jgi:pimeloyl-ACP methyl ester carboxylesterase
MLHGTLGHKDMEIISTLQLLFAENDRSSLAINLSLDVDDRHGFFPCDQPHRHKLDDAGAELDAWLAWLRTRGSGTPVLLGHSRGANQVARYIVERQPPIAAAVLIAPSTSALAPAAAVAMTRGAPDDWLDPVDFLHCEDARVRRDSYLSYYGLPSDTDTPALLRKIATPVIVFSGSEDSVVPDLGAAMAGIERSNVTHREIAGAGHFFRDLYMYDIVDATLEFLPPQ